ncbi:MAG: hypothetical protein JNN30_16825 [Rhodanobacteraceae bacterium]|nr:hypothetical protein [Rhodanobacteraceae bacterium]
MNAAQPVYLTSAGAVTSLGFDLPSTAAAIRAAVDNFRETHFIDGQGERIAAGRIDRDDDESRLGGSEHLAALLAMAIEECLQSSGIQLPLAENVPLFLLGDDTRPKPFLETAYACHAHCSRFFKRPEQLHMQAFTAGESSCIAALLAAREFLARGAPHVLIAGVDSWLSVADIDFALETGRLLSSGQAAGFVPGEAASAVLVSARPNSAHDLVVAGIGEAQEPASLFAEEICVGRGLASAIKAALRQAGRDASEISLRLTDLAGEDYFFEEAAYAWARVLRESLPPEYRFSQPATRTGHVGAAFGPLLLGYAWQLGRCGRLPGPHTLIHLSSAQPLRGALVISQPQHRSRQEFA